jgi:diadenosine tetraphosphate (Ap4A) HIT family hydrolase
MLIMRDPNNPCLFCNIKESGLADENNLAYASYDSYPVSDLHCLIIPKRHVKDYFELTDEEIIACNTLIKNIKAEIENKDPSVRGFNIGTNVGKISGQSILHCHIHLIPRREGDVENPQGGVRSVIPLKQYYNRKV